MSQPFLPVFLVAAAALSGCGMAWDKPGNAYVAADGQAFMAERRDMPSSVGENDEAVRFNSKRCSAPAQDLAKAATTGTIGNNAMPLSPGDLVQLSLPGNEAPSGNYKVGSTGMLLLDSFGEIAVAGRTIEQAEADLGRRLVANGFYRAGYAHVTLKLLDRAAVHVWVSGAVFQPGRVVVNEKSGADRDAVHDLAPGDHGPGRALSSAIAGASGVRPDADIQHIRVSRAAETRVIDLSGLMTGGVADDILLADGDRVDVPSRGCFQAELARPSAITMPGVRAYISNLAIPAAGNGIAGVGRDATTFPYGTRLLQALVSGNCIGGTQSTNADRWTVLISANPVTGQSEVIERRVEALVRRADRDAYNPVILPGDSIACYDSPVTNLRDVLKAMTESVSGLVPKL